ncbi:MAG: BamA/TamA family outer membrane protein [Acidobacteriia bacterium]|nr:BamA/TamA family outer membrane protein [Terriglobia bacterium]
MRLRFLVPVVVLLLAALAHAQDYTFFGKNKVRYDTFTWKVYATPHFRISFYDRVEPSLGKLASFAESAYDELARRLNFQIKDPVPIIAFATHTEFEQNNVIVDFIPEGIGAFAVPSRNRMVLPVDMPDEMLQKLVQHELTHVFQFEILYQGRLGKALSSRVPQWFTEGMASYMGNDEDARARAVMRDAVASDRVPSVTTDVEGYAAYRFGHMVFQFVESEWGVEGLRDFVYEFRNTLGGGVQKTIKRAFDLDVDEFDSRFRAWLRKYYQPLTTDRSEPREFGPAFRAQEGTRPSETSPVASPSGDLIAAMSTYKDDVDVVLLGVPNRELFRNLTPGESTRYLYLVGQMLTVGPDRGRDISFSPEGNRVAVFARHERGRVLLLLNALKGGIEREIPIPLDQAMEPAFSPDGKSIAFHAVANGRADIFLLDLDSGKIENLTNDEAYDSDPVFTADGKHLVYSSQTAENAKIYEISLADRGTRRQLTFGPGNDEGGCFSRDGRKLFFASDRDQGIFDIYALDLEARDLSRLTRVVGSALNPVVVPTRDGERVVYQAYSKGREWLYVTDPSQGKPVGKEELPAVVKERPPYVPAVTVTVSKDKIEPVKTHKLFIDNAQVLVGINSDNTVISQTYLSFADNYGDRRLDVLLASESSFSNFYASYVNLGKRLEWGVSVFDSRSYYVYASLAEDNIQRQRTYRQTGGALFATYPLSIYHRVEGAVGYIDQSVDYPFIDQNGLLAFVSQTNKVPFAQVSFTGDTTFWQDYGPHGGHRYQIKYMFALNGSGGGVLSKDIVVDGRQYVPLSRRNELAFRLYAASASGQLPDLYYFGGLDTLRGFDYDSLVGNHAAYLNTEWRFPLIDHLDLPWLRLAEVRGRFFLDVGGAWLDVPGYKQPFRCVNNSQLQDCVSSYGFGMSLDLFGLPVNWDFSKQWDFKHTLDKTAQTWFWVGFQF